MKCGDIVVVSDSLNSTELWTQTTASNEELFMTGRFSLCDVAIVLCIEEEEVKVLTNRGAIGWTLNFRLKRVEQ